MHCERDANNEFMKVVSTVYCLVGWGDQQCTVLSISMKQKGCEMPSIWINLKHPIYGFESCCKFTRVLHLGDLYLQAGNYVHFLGKSV